jgi:hypothetical protein
MLVSRILYSRLGVSFCVLSAAACRAVYNLAGGTPTGFIDKVFNDLLVRPPAATNLQQWQGDANVRVDLPNMVLAGAPNEYFMAEVTMYYNAYLRRFPNTQPDRSRLRHQSLRQPGVCGCAQRRRQLA